MGSVGSGGFSEMDCCRLPGVIQQLWEDLPCSSPYFSNSFSIRLSLWLAWKEKGIGDSGCDWCFFFVFILLVTKSKARGCNMLMCSRSFSG